MRTIQGFSIFSEEFLVDIFAEQKVRVEVRLQLTIFLLSKTIGLKSCSEAKPEGQ